MRCVLRLDGQLDGRRLARAFRLSLDAEPVVGCRFVRHRGRFSWERRADLDLLPLCLTLPCPDPQTHERELQRFIVAPMDITAGPAATARLLRGEADTLVVKLHHFAADGFGLLRFLMVLATTYRELAADPGYRPRPNLGERGLGPVLRRVGPLGMLIALGSLRPPPRAASWGPIATGASYAGRAFAMRRLGPERVRALRAWGHAHQVSVNDLLLTALYSALAATIGAAPGRPLTVGVPVDLRRHLAPGQSPPVCNLSNSANVTINYRPGASFDEILRQVHPAMRSLKTTGRGLALAALAEALAIPGFALARTAFEQMLRRIAPLGSAAPFLSNVGVIDAGLVDFGHVMVTDAYGLGSVSLPPGLLLTASTFRETMTLAIGYCATATEGRLVERVLDRLAEELSCAMPLP